MSKVRNEKKRETILPMMIPGSYAAFSKNFSTKNPMIVENSPQTPVFLFFFLLAVPAGFFEERHAACSASERLGRAPSALEEARFVKRKPAASAVNGATVTSPKLPTTVSKISAATYL